MINWERYGHGMGKMAEEQRPWAFEAWCCNLSRGYHRRQRPDEEIIYLVARPGWARPTCVKTPTHTHRDAFKRTRGTIALGEE